MVDVSVCGERYTHLVRSASGRTPDARCFAFCNVPDAQDWHTGARNLLNTMETYVQRASDDAGVRDMAQRARDAFAAIEEPSTWSWPGGATVNAIVSDSITAMGLAACAMEMASGIIEDRGGTLPAIPGASTRKPKDGLPGWLVPVAVVGGVYLLGRFTR